MQVRTKLPASASFLQRLTYPFLRNFMYFFFTYLPYAPIRRVNKPDLSGPFLWAGSHSNFMCDAIPAGYEGPMPTKFLGKSTLLKFPIKTFMEFCGVLPLARAEDHKDMDRAARAAQNRATFKAAIAALRDGWPVAIFPEGMSVVSPGLVLPLKPGVARLALSAEEACNFSLDLRIIPVGLEYGSRKRVGSGLYIRYGNPLYLGKYKELFELDADQAVKKIMEDLTKELIASFPHFADEAKLKLGKKLVAIGISRNKYEVAQLFQRKHSDPDFWVGLEQKLSAFDEASRSHGIPVPAWGHRQAWKQLGSPKRTARILYLIAGFPAFLIDLPNNAIPEFFVSSATEFFSTDETEIMSIRFILSPVILGITYALQFLFLEKFVFNGLLLPFGAGAYIVYTLSSFVLWYVAVHWRRQFKRVASLFFFRWAGVNGRSESVNKYRDLRQYFSQF